MSTNEFADPFDDYSKLRDNWGWILFIGILLIALGVVCIVGNVTATFVSIEVFGWLLAISGVFALVQAFQVHTWKGFFLYLLDALLRGFVGYLLIRYPDVGAAGLTMVLAAFFIVGGLFRAIGAAMLQFPQWGWATFSGIVAFVLGIFLLAQWPSSSMWFVGLYIGIDMIVDGASLVAFASSLHELPKLPEYKEKHA